ncbi:response regulator transcription factor [Paenibacillus sp. MSJ-34]|uniref:response regulator transcription factor n=1 Tax=Paenibacillus sp. MSJ-34 TaxID=2841529 RepID=UPI001C0F8A3A|nr:response regulator [Paenibacillus sp. MSJ-34]MBU5445669.1 response regulator [Paenibacillus sp. MSJ-34]
MYRILVVDDQKVEVETITWLLRKHHLPLIVSQAFHGEDALAQIRDQHFDILFTDIKMPFIDGLELASRAKEMRPDLKVIIYSAFSRRFARPVFRFA